VLTLNTIGAIVKIDKTIGGQFIAIHSAENCQNTVPLSKASLAILLMNPGNLIHLG
jgi:hypothetical protein